MRGGIEVDDAFIEEHRPLVRSLAHRLKAQLDLSCDLDELIAFGLRGLVEASRRFDPSRGVQFNTFAYYRVRGAILDGVRDMAYLPRRAHAIRRAVEAGDRVLEDLGESRAAAPPGTRTTREDAAAAIDDTLGKLSAAYVMASVGQDLEPPATPEEELLEVAEADRVRAALDVLPERERALVEGFYFEGRRFDEVARELGISKSWASRLHTRALGRLREALESEAA